MDWRSQLGSGNATASDGEMQPGLAWKGGGFLANEARPRMERTFSDITNRGKTTGDSTGKRPLVDPKTPARRSRAGHATESGLAVFEDELDEAPSVLRHPTSPPSVRPKSRQSNEEEILGNECQMIGIEEVTEAEFLTMDSFSSPPPGEDVAWHHFAADPDGFGSPEELARMLAAGPEPASAQASGGAAWWAREMWETGQSGRHELDQAAWQSLSPSPRKELPLDLASSALSHSPLLAEVDIDDLMDVDSEGDRDKRLREQLDFN